ncbi:MAG: hypothetical protein AVDCRST_MAG49-1005, partial [uncultured Thermomicrobiales bacterium]
DPRASPRRCGPVLRQRRPQPGVLSALARPGALRLRRHAALHRPRRARLRDHRSGGGGRGAGRGRGGPGPRPRRARRRRDRPLQPQGRAGRVGPRAGGAGPDAGLATGRGTRLPRRRRPRGRCRVLRPDGPGRDPGADHAGAAAGGQLGRLVDRAAGPDRRVGRRRGADRRRRDRDGLRPQRGHLPGLGVADRAAAHPRPRRPGRGGRPAWPRRLRRRRPGRARLRPPRPAGVAAGGGAVGGVPRGRGDRRDAGRPVRAAPGALPGRLRLADRGDRRGRAGRPADPERAGPRPPGRALAVRALRDSGGGGRAAGRGDAAAGGARDPLRLRAEHRDRRGGLQHGPPGGGARRRAGPGLHPARRGLEREPAAVAGGGRPDRRRVRRPAAVLVGRHAARPRRGARSGAARRRRPAAAGSRNAPM